MANSGLAGALGNPLGTDNRRKRTVKTYNIDTGDATSLSIKTNGATAATIDSSGNLQLTTAGAKILNASSKPILQQTGSVLQVVTATTNSAVTVTSATYTDTGLSATITPTSLASKILVLVSQPAYATRTAAFLAFGVRLMRGASAILTPTENASGPYEYGINAPLNGTTTECGVRVCVNYLDSPATTSSVTYKTQGRPFLTSNSGTVIFQDGSTTAGTATIVLMEIAA